MSVQPGTILTGYYLGDPYSNPGGVAPTAPPPPPPFATVGSAMQYAIVVPVAQAGGAVPVSPAAPFPPAAPSTTRPTPQPIRTLFMILSILQLLCSLIAFICLIVLGLMGDQSDWFQRLPWIAITVGVTPLGIWGLCVTTSCLGLRSPVLFIVLHLVLSAAGAGLSAYLWQFLVLILAFSAGSSEQILPFVASLCFFIWLVLGVIGVILDLVAWILRCATSGRPLAESTAGGEAKEMTVFTAVQPLQAASAVVYPIP